MHHPHVILTTSFSEIKVTDQGLGGVEVIDDGHGIPSADYGTVALRYTTSKLSEMSDFDSLKTLGFRGEGLNSLCSAAKVTAITRTAQDAFASSLVFDDQGV